MRFLVVGLGSIGRRHLQNLRLLGHEVVAVDPDPTAGEAVATLPGVELVPTLAAGLEGKPHAVLVCTPPASHLPVARAAIGAGLHTFVEKPLAISPEGVEELIHAAADRGLQLLAGANLRFFRSLRRLKSLLDDGTLGRVLSVRAQCGFYLPFWNGAKDYRATYRARAATGGGILLDAIHELDYLRWLFGEPEAVFCAAGMVSGLEIDVEDLAEVTLRFPQGVLAQLHLDYLQRSYRRDCEVIGDQGVAVWDYIRREVVVFTGEPDRWHGFRDPIDANHNEMFVEEMRHLIGCLNGDASPLIGGGEALRSLRLVEAARRSSREGRWVRP